MRAMVSELGFNIHFSNVDRVNTHSEKVNVNWVFTRVDCTPGDNLNTQNEGFSSC